MPYNEELAKRIRVMLGRRRKVQEKKMFGGVGFLVYGNMACGVHKQEMIVRLSDKDFASTVKGAHARVFDITGRPMKGWVLVSAGGTASDKTLQDLVDKSVAFAKSLPPK